MKTTLSIFLFAAIFSLNAQISTTRMNDLKLGMSLSETESLVGQSLELTKEDWIYETKITNKGVDLKLFFTENQDENGMTNYSLYEIETTSPNIKTLSKIGIGSSLDDLWKAYKNYSISIWKIWDDKTEKYSETERIFHLQDLETSTVLYFYLKNDKIYKISLNYFEGC